ncbi:polyprenyl synthetase family protein [Paenibacillus sp. HJGM_3]|uniref:polyprenyl synthetase family protein n=1 Tax=Paenibacillus sp. HJGM_3 TaxID=3379816 RepID=UPI0038598574
MKMPLAAPLTQSAKPDPIDRIRVELLADDLERYAEMMEQALKPQQPYLSDTEYNLYRRGKKLRPMMMLLSARMLHGPDTPLPQKAIQGAVSLEMLHVATLIHDDIIDDALVRRGMASVNASRGVEAAILIGDMQFVQAIRGFVDAIDTQQDMGLVKLVLDTAFRICCGELDELETDPSLSPAELRKRYMETIERKTAILFGLACESGATLAGGRTSDSRRAGFYGRRVGRAFQIMDDLFDFVQDDAASGKTRGMDLSRRRMSLPILYAMEELGPWHPVSRIMRGAEYSREELETGVVAVRHTAGFNRAYADARSQALDALEYLKPFPRNRYRKALEDIALYVVDRSF